MKNKAGISEVTFYLPALSKQDYSRGFWLYGLGGSDGPYFGGDDGDLGDRNGSLFGVVGSGAADARKISRADATKLSYTQKEIDRYLKIVEEVKEGNIKISKLESKLNPLTDFLLTLKK